MQGRMDELRTVTFDSVDRGWYADEYEDRMVQRQRIGNNAYIPTGLHGLDKLFGGGAYESFLGIWLAYPKTGKTTILTNLGVTAVRSCWKRTLHIVLEGSRGMVESRYDAIFSDDLYASVKAGETDASKYALAASEMKYLRGMLVIRGFTDRWDASIVDIDAEMQDLRRTYGWDPAMVIVDYGDLLRSRGPAKSETEAQISAFKDMKTLANRGKVVWTASQARRPTDDDFDTMPTILKSKSIADAYGKVRIADFVGSLNATQQERTYGVNSAEGPSMRVFAELFRDGPANQLYRVPIRFDKMQIDMARGYEIQFEEGAKKSNAPANAEGHVQKQKPLGFFHTPGPPAPYQQTTNGVARPNGHK
jgi:hypothetical protein